MIPATWKATHVTQLPGKPHLKFQSEVRACVPFPVLRGKSKGNYKILWDKNKQKTHSIENKQT